MRRILCFFLALCLLPVAGFAEIKKPQHMNALTFLHRYLYAMEAIGAAEAAYTFTPVLYTDIAEDEIYVMFNSLRLTLDRNTHDILYIDCAYSYEDNENVDILYQMVPAVIFALSENDLSQEYHRNLLNKGALVPYKDPAAARMLVDAINESGGEVNGYYGSANGQGEIQFRPNWFNSPPRAPFFPPDNAQPMTRGVHLYQFYTAFYFANDLVSTAALAEPPTLRSSILDLLSYRVAPHTTIGVLSDTLEVIDSDCFFVRSKDELDLGDLQEVLICLFALSERPLLTEKKILSQDRFLNDFWDKDALNAYLNKLLDEAMVGTYSFYLYDTSPKSVSYWTSSNE